MELLTSGMAVVFRPGMLLMVVVAVFLGTLFGALPGVSGTMAVTLGIPFTYSMNATDAIVFLVAIYCASITGGGMTAILFKIPGVPSSAPTTYDGYPMAQRGEAGKALGMQLICSAVGGIFAALCMLFLSPQLTQAALSFGPAELFAISFMGLSILTSLDTDNICRTIISGMLGLLMACIGLDPLLGVPRLTFGTRFLNSGIEMIPVMIGFFAVTEVLKQTYKPAKLKAVGSDTQSGKLSAELPSLKEFLSVKWVVLRCSVVGDPLRRVNTNDNTPAMLHLRMVPGDRISITVAPKGAGSENMSSLRMMTPAATADQIVDYVVQAVETAGSNPCPPVVVGVGIGGNFEGCALLAKRALCRDTSSGNPDPFYRELEKRMLERINQTGIGPQGFGGRVTALAVNIEAGATHIASLPVAVNICCHVNRHAVRTI